MEQNHDKCFKLTPQRLAIVGFLKGNKSHPSADDIYQAVRKQYPTMSLATIYTTLSALRDRGAVLELMFDPDKKRYDPDTQPHDHLICVSCRNIVDIPEKGAGKMPADDRGFALIASSVHFYGICPKCRDKDNSFLKEDSHVCRS